MKLLPLSPPTCKRFLAVLAALVQTGAAEAASRTAGEEEPRQALTRQDDFGDLTAAVSATAPKIATLLIIGLTLMVSWASYQSWGRSLSPRRRSRAGEGTKEAAVQSDPIEIREIACQSPCTYTAVRREVGPFRFKPLPDTSHGSWR